MKLTQEEILTLALMGDAFVEDGSYLLENECTLMRRILDENPKLENKFPWLTYFLEHGEPPRAKRMTTQKLRERNKAAKNKPVSKPKEKKKRGAPQKTCPECEVKVHARKKICPCGYEF